MEHVWTLIHVIYVQLVNIVLGVNIEPLVSLED